MSNNGKTFKSSSMYTWKVFDDPTVKKHFAELRVEWTKKSTKRCLKKTVGRACLTFDKVLTLVIKIEAMLNSRSLS